MRSGFHIWPVGAGEAMGEVATNEEETVVVAPLEKPAKTPSRT
jgi:hypothetical protein